MNCSKCKRRTPKRGFATFRTRKGELRRRGVCQKCRNGYAEENFERLQAWRKEYNKKNRRKKKLRDTTQKAIAKKYVDAYKAKHPCKDCGKKWPPVAMDLDHVRGGKTRGIANMVSSGYKLDLIKIELKKCDLVCACCHRLRTAKNGHNHAPRRTGISRGGR